METERRITIGCGENKESETNVRIENFYITDEMGEAGYMQLDLKVMGKRDPMTYGKLHKAIAEVIKSFNSSTH